MGRAVRSRNLIVGKSVCGRGFTGCEKTRRVLKGHSFSCATSPRFFESGRFQSLGAAPGLSDKGRVLG